jgi:hypothetical protein
VIPAPNPSLLQSPSRPPLGPMDSSPILPSFLIHPGSKTPPRPPNPIIHSETNTPPPNPVIHYQSNTSTRPPALSTFVPDDEFPPSELDSHQSSADVVIPPPNQSLLQSPHRQPIVVMREIVPRESVDSMSQSSIDVPSSSAMSDVMEISPGEIEVNLLLPPDEELQTVKLPANGTVRDALIAAEHLDSNLIVSDHFAHICEDETELSNDTLLSELPKPCDLWICRRQNVSHSPILCQSPIPELDSPEMSEPEPEINLLENPPSLTSLPLSDSEPEPEVNTLENSLALTSHPVSEPESQSEVNALEDSPAPPLSEPESQPEVNGPEESPAPPLSEPESQPEVNGPEESPAPPLEESELQPDLDIQNDSPVISSSHRVLRSRRHAIFNPPSAFLPRPLNYGGLLRQLQSVTLLDIHVCRQYLNHYHYNFMDALTALRAL